MNIVDELIYSSSTEREKRYAREIYYPISAAERSISSFYAYGAIRVATQIFFWTTCVPCLQGALHIYLAQDARFHRKLKSQHPIKIP